MRKKDIRWFERSFIVLLVLFWTGCAGSGGSLISPGANPPNTDELLTAAGFKQIIPMNSDQRTKLLNLPQKKFFLISKGSKVYYIYADASGCGCLYAGSQEQYRNFQSMLSRAETAYEEQAAYVDDWDWNAWAPGWWGETGIME